MHVNLLKWVSSVQFEEADQGDGFRRRVTAEEQRDMASNEAGRRENRPWGNVTYID